VMPTRILRPAAGDAAIIGERAHCEVYENSDITNQLRHWSLPLPFRTDESADEALAPDVPRW